MLLDARERSSCTSIYWDPAFRQLKLSKKRSWAKTTCLEAQSWHTVPSPLIFHFKHCIIHHKHFDLSRNMLLHFLVKFEKKIKYYCFWQHPQQTVDMFLKTLWGLDLTFNSYRLMTLIKWLTFWRLESTVERCSVERCCIMVIFSQWLFLMPRTVKFGVKRPC